MFDVGQSDGDSWLRASQENGDVANVEENLRVIKNEMAEVWGLSSKLCMILFLCYFRKTFHKLDIEVV